ncbi:hypothetical protein SRABI106_04335 [Rahnella aquatilis]|nr:hypothetical protein SRABI106_04335 [Rahnella aquatilis]
MPDLNVLEVRMASVSMLHSKVINVATLSMIIRMALLVVITGCATQPRLGLLITA